MTTNYSLKTLTTRFFEILHMDKAAFYADEMVNLCYLEALELIMNKWTETEREELRTMLKEKTEQEALDFLGKKIGSDTYKEVLLRVAGRRFEEYLRLTTTTITDAQKNELKLLLRDYPPRDGSGGSTP